MDSNPSLLRLHPAQPVHSISQLIFDLNAPQMMEHTPPDPKIGIKRQFVCPFWEMSKQMNKSRSAMLAELTVLGFDFDSLARADELQLHLALLPAGGVFPPHLHFIGHELYFGLKGEGLMRIGQAMQDGKAVLAREEVSAPERLTCLWSDKRTKPLMPSSAFLVKTGEVHSLTNPASSDLYFAFLCGGWHLVENGDRLFLPAVR